MIFEVVYFPLAVEILKFVLVSTGLANEYAFVFAYLGSDYARYGGLTSAGALVSMT